MIAAAFSLILLQQAAPAVVWEAPAVEPAEAAAPQSAAHNVPDWGLADPFGYERARCSPLVRGTKPLDVCQAEVRGQLALALGADLPEALRPAGMADNCEMTREAAGGSAYALQCARPSRAPETPRAPQEMDCRPRPVEGGFTSECRPVDGPANKGVSLKLWGDDD